MYLFTRSRLRLTKRKKQSYQGIHIWVFIYLFYRSTFNVEHRRFINFFHEVISILSNRQTFFLDCQLILSDKNYFENFLYVSMMSTSLLRLNKLLIQLIFSTVSFFFLFHLLYFQVIGVCEGEAHPLMKNIVFIS